MKALKKIAELAAKFESKMSFAQTQEADYTLVDSIRKALGPAITADVGNILNTRAVSSIPIRVSYNKPKASFMVSSTGSDAEAVNKEVAALLDKKYSAKVSAMLGKSKSTNFEFGLLTVE